MEDQGTALPLRTFSALPLTLPEREVFKRLGGNVHRTVLDDGTARKLDAAMRRGAALCHAAGCWTAAAIRHADSEGLTLANGMRIASRALAACIGSAPWLWVGLATIGGDLGKAVTAADPVTAAILDAVGSECADQAMDRLQSQARQELQRNGLLLAERRFSPGYGDLPLTAQQQIFTLLGPEPCGVRLNEQMVMLPEKSVTAFAALTALPGTETAER